MFLCKWCCKKNHRKMKRTTPILVLGIDNAGKTSIVKRIQGEPIISVVPTIGFNNVKIKYSSKYEVILYDLGGSEQFRNIWKQYIGTAYGIIYVVDSNDYDRIEENSYVLKELLSDEHMRYKPVLLLANKQDIEGAMDEVDIVERLNLNTLVNTYKCPTTIELCNTIEPPIKNKCCQKSNISTDGIQIGFRWLMKQIDENYDDLQLRIEENIEKEYNEQMKRKEKWKQEKKMREDENGDDESDEEIQNKNNGNPFKPVDQILSAKSLSNGYKSMDKDNDETDISNFQIKHSREDLHDTEDIPDQNDNNKKKNPKKRKKKVAPINDNNFDGNEIQLPPLRLPGRNVNMAWTEETQINLPNGDDNHISSPKTPR